METSGRWTIRQVTEGESYPGYFINRHTAHSGGRLTSAQADGKRFLRTASRLSVSLGAAKRRRASNQAHHVPTGS
jgi:sensor domain CHASE-containing protein